MKPIEFFIDKIFHDDCMNILKEIPPESIDLVIADFPYAVSQYSSLLTRVGGKYVKADFGEWDRWDNTEEYISWVFNVCNEIERVLKKDAVFFPFFNNRFGSWFAMELMRKKLFVYKMPIVWEKINPVPHCRKTSFRNCMEVGHWLIKSKVDYLGDFDAVVKPKTFNFLKQEEMCNVMKYAIGDKYTTHPTEKPLKLTTRIIKIFTNEGDIVLDPFVGSGTTCVSARSIRRHFIGIDIDKNYVKMTLKRLGTFKCKDIMSFQKGVN